MKRRGGPSVQQWIDSIPLPTNNDVIITESMSPASSSSSSSTSSSYVASAAAATTTTTTTATPSKFIVKNMIYSKNPVMMTVSTPKSSSPDSPVIPSLQSSPLHGRLVRDPSFQSDSSHCSSVESLLELRKADPEAILLGLGFGGCTNVAQESGPLSRIPKRFLQPSKLKGIAINDFVKQQQETSESIDTASLGYRGLTGSPFVAPSEIVQKIMERLREHESHEIDAYDAYSAFNTDSYSPLQMQDGRLSVLSPDSRQFVQRSRSISPDMRNKRMIIGQKSFAFGCDGDLIEINPINIQNRLATDYHQNNDINNLFIKTNSFNIDSMNYINHHKIIKETSAESIDKRKFNISELDQIHNNHFDNINNQLIYKHIDDKNNNSSGIEIKINSECEWENINKTFDNSRRASDSSCEIQTSINEIVNHSDERRFSDSLINDIDSKKRKKNNFKRQARIIDDEAEEYCESLEPNTSIQSSLCDDEQLLEHDNKTKVMCDLKKHHLCCKSDELGQICKHTEGTKDCCYHASNTSCWKKMKKIIKKNQKLENMVVKSRQEMAEIREMLSSVLSIRMEPGF